MNQKVHLYEAQGSAFKQNRCISKHTNAVYLTLNYKKLHMSHTVCRNIHTHTHTTQHLFEQDSNLSSN